MLTKVDIQNYRSIYRASIPLSPFTLLIGANGTGKSNFLKVFQDASARLASPIYGLSHFKHWGFSSEPLRIAFTSDSGTQAIIQDSKTGVSGSRLLELKNVRIFSLVPQNVGATERLVPTPTVRSDGKGVVQVLDSLKTGDREDLFNLIEQILTEHIPEIEKLSFAPNFDGRQLQVRERYLPNPTLVSQLSEGMQLALMIITILHQEHKPSLVCIEDIDRGLHPRLFQSIVELCFDLSRDENGVQIIATTHNPYLVDEFKDNEEAVIIVEKEHGQTKFSTFADKLSGVEPVEEPLGSLWYSGFVSGVPQRA